MHFQKNSFEVVQLFLKFSYVHILKFILNALAKKKIMKSFGYLENFLECILNDFQQP